MKQFKVPCLNAGMELEEIASLHALIAATVISCLLKVKLTKVNNFTKIRQL
jgi:hypothetical protein